MRKSKDTETAVNTSAGQDILLLLYLKQIAATHPLTSKEEAELTTRIRSGDQKALNALVTANLRFVVSVSRNYQNQGVPLIDLINEGNLGLIEAARRFDERKNFRFISYAVWWIRQAILSLLAERSRIVRIPLNRAGDLHRIGTAKRKLEQSLKRNPTIEELACELQTDVTSLQSIMQAGARHSSLDMSDDENSPDLYSVLPSKEEHSIDDRLFEFSLCKEMDTALKVLDSREKEIIKMNFGIGHDTSYTLQEIGIKYDISRERVRQIRQQALVKLQRISVKQKLEHFLSR